MTVYIVGTFVVFLALGRLAFLTFRIVTAPALVRGEFLFPSSHYWPNRCTCPRPLFARPKRDYWERLCTLAHKGAMHSGVFPYLCTFDGRGTVIGRDSDFDLHVRYALQNRSGRTYIDARTLSLMESALLRRARWERA